MKDDSISSISTLLLNISELIKLCNQKKDLIELLNRVTNAILEDSCESVLIDKKDSPSNGQRSNSENELNKTIEELKKELTKKQAEHEEDENYITNLKNNFEINESNYKKEISNLKKYADELKKVKEEINGKVEIIKELELSNKEQKISIDSISKDNQELTQELDKIKKESSKLKKDYQDLQNTPDLYEYVNFVNKSINKMSDTDKDNLGHFIYGSPLICMVQCGDITQIKNTFESYAKKIIQEPNTSSNQISYFFKQIICFYNKANPQTRVDLIEPNVGDIYDTEQHSRPNNVNGNRVVKVLFPGIKTFRDKVLIKAVVLL